MAKKTPAGIGGIWTCQPFGQMSMHKYDVTDFTCEVNNGLISIKLNAKPFSDSVLYCKDSVNYVEFGNNTTELFKNGNNMFRLILHLMSKGL